MKTYSEKLKDPRWQRKRLEVMSRDGFTCQVCQATDKTLHVHHIRYIKGREPWEYRQFYFVTLCMDCHETEEREIKVPYSKIPYSKTQPRTSKASASGLSAFDAMIINAPNSIEDATSNEKDTEDLDAFFAGLKNLLSDEK